MLHFASNQHVFLMKNHITLLVFLHFSVILFAQNAWKNGYVIDMEGNKTEGLILDEGWLSSPERVTYRLDSLDDAVTGTIAEIKEFSIPGYVRFVRADVLIDQSRDDINYYSRQYQPEWQRDTVFLRYLIDGGVSLLYFDKKDLKRFFFQLPGGDIRQLVYKRYVLESVTYKENNQYLVQLTNEFNCSQTPVSDDIGYNRKDLVQFFIQQNTCLGFKYDNYDKGRTTTSWNVWVMFGLNYSKLKMAFYNTPILFPDQATLTGGLELEAILPFKNRKWSVPMGGLYTTYSDTAIGRFNEINYRAIHLCIGPRYSFYLKKGMRLYIGGQRITYLPIPIKYNGEKLSFGGRWTGNIGLIAGRWGVEITYLPPKNILIHKDFNYKTTSSFQTISMQARFRINR